MERRSHVRANDRSRTEGAGAERVTAVSAGGASCSGEASVPARFQVLLALAEGERDIGALCAETAQTCPVPEPHLAILRRLGLVDAGGQDRQRSYGLTVLGEQLVATIDALLESTTSQEIDRGPLEGYTESRLVPAAQRATPT